MTELDLSVVIPTHDRVESLARCLMSLAAQTLPREQYEIIVVSNRDDYRVAEKVSALRAAGLNCRYFFSNKVGVNRARNCGWVEARAPQVLFLDDDCELKNCEFLQNVVRVHDQHADSFAVGWRYQAAEGSCWRARCSAALVEAWLARRPNHLVGGAMSFKRNAETASLRFNDSIIYGASEISFQDQVNAVSPAAAVLDRSCAVIHHVDTRFNVLVKKAWLQGLHSQHNEWAQKSEASPRLKLQRSFYFRDWRWAYFGLHALFVTAGRCTARLRRLIVGRGLITASQQDVAPPATVNDGEVRAFCSKQVVIYIIAHNEAGTIQRCLHAIHRQRGWGEPLAAKGIVVIDNASTDSTALQAQSCGARVIRQTTNHMALARQAALDDDVSTAAIFLDADCEPTESWLAELCEDWLNLRAKRLSLSLPGLSHPSSSLSRSTLLKPCHQEIVVLGGRHTPPRHEHWFHAAQAALTRSFFGHLGSAQAKTFERAARVNHVPTCNAIVDRSRLLELGGFAPDFAHVGEDLELSARIRKAGLWLAVTPRAHVLHRQRVGFTKWCRRIFFYGVARSRVLIRHPQSLSLSNVMPLTSAAFAVVAAFATLAFTKASAMGGFVLFERLAVARDASIGLMILYFSFVMLESLRAAWCERGLANRSTGAFLPHSASVALLMISAHASYSLGQCVGLACEILRQTRRSIERSACIGR